MQTLRLFMKADIKFSIIQYKVFPCITIILQICLALISKHILFLLMEKPRPLLRFKIWKKFI